MIGSILVPLDGSRLAEVAIPVATRLARVAHARLRLVLAHEVTAAEPDSTGDHRLDRRALRRDYLVKLAGTLGLAIGSEVRQDELDGQAEVALVDFIEDQRPDLVVMATRGRGVSSRWLGSVAGHVARTVSSPVLLVHVGDRAIESDAQFRRALVILEAAGGCAEFLGPVADLAGALQCHLTLLQVIEDAPRRPSSGESLAARRATAQSLLDEVASRLRERGLSVASRAVFGNEVGPAVLDQLRSGRIDLVALEPGAGTESPASMRGDIADQIIRLGATPILSYRSRAAVPTG